MERKAFLGLGCSCGMMSLLGAVPIAGQDQVQSANGNTHVPQDMNHDQVKNILKYIDSLPDKSAKEGIFSQLGHECFHTRKLDDWIETYTDDVQGFLDWVNIEKKSKYWEKLEFNADRTVLTLTGKKVRGCACAFSDCPDPPKSLCHYCCRNFQQELFGILLGRNVTVEITAAFLFGDDHCDTVIHMG